MAWGFRALSAKYLPGANPRPLPTFSRAGFYVSNGLNRRRWPPFQPFRLQTVLQRSLISVLCFRSKPIALTYRLHLQTTARFPISLYVVVQRLFIHTQYRCHCRHALPGFDQPHRFQLEFEPVPVGRRACATCREGTYRQADPEGHRVEARKDTHADAAQTDTQLEDRRRFRGAQVHRQPINTPSGQIRTAAFSGPVAVTRSTMIRGWELAASLPSTFDNAII